jgi:hypothetical protein
MTIHHHQANIQYFFSNYVSKCCFIQLPYQNIDFNYVYFRSSFGFSANDHKKGPGLENLITE